MTDAHINRHYQLLLADVAMAMAISTHDRDYPVAERLADYAPGRLRDDWLAQVGDAGLRLRVVGLANAGMGSLQRLGHEELCAAAVRYGIPIDPALAESIAEHFEERRNAVRRYDRS